VADVCVLRSALLFGCDLSDILKVKFENYFYSAIKSEDSEALDGGTSQLGSQRGYGEIRMF